MKNQIIKHIQLKIILILTFMVLYSIAYNINSINKETNISTELQNSIKNFKLNYDITNYHNKIQTDVINFIFSKNKKLIKLLSQSLKADDNQKKILRKKLYKLLKIQFTAMTKRGIKILLFAHPNNKILLRMHAPSKYGDDIGKIRYGISMVNKTKKPLHGFEQGRISHAFRNIYPLFNKNNQYLGCFDISYSSENMQNTLIDVNKIHSHFLVNKNILNTKIWKTKNKESIYNQSIEHKDYMISIFKDTYHKDLLVSKNIIAKHQKYINKNIKDSKEFAIYGKSNGDILVISFIPISNIKNSKKTAAYIVAYTHNIKIVEILDLFKYTNIIMFILLSLGLYLIYHLLVNKKELEEKVGKKTHDLKELNEYLEEKVIKKTEEIKEKHNYIRKILDTQQNFILITNEEDLKQTNQPTLNFIGYKTLEDFYKEHNSICEFFLEEEGYLQKEQEGKTWIKVLETNSTIIHQVKMKDLENNVHTFQVNTSGTKIKDEEYVITFTDITKLKELQNAIEEESQKRLVINEELEQSEQETQILNETLEKRVKEEVEKNIQKERQLLESAKMASMGEMIGNIAHQWRQPLSGISSAILSMQIKMQNDKYNLNNKNDRDELFDIIKQKGDRVNQYVDHLSKTIDTFRDFIKEEKELKEVVLQDRIDKTLEIIDSSLQNHFIKLKKYIDYSNPISITIVTGELEQVIINLLNNAKDVLIQNNIQKPWIEISLTKNDSKAIITIEDNGGGVPDKYISKIFNPYFTTKHQSQGTGLGLSMSYNIITQSLKGKLYVKNTNNGAKFFIELPI